jgi:hypothetical protein
MSEPQKQNITDALAELGLRLLTPDADLMTIIDAEQQHNAWFTPNSTLQAVTAVGQMLNRESLEHWLVKYHTNNAGGRVVNVGLILAGNIPLVGIHDVLSVLASGHRALIKASSQDARLIKYILSILANIYPPVEKQFEFVDRLAGFDAIIATGSNNTSRYFEYYFGKVPNIIRKNRNSVALLTGHESKHELYSLGHDIFDYFGLGCRNVSKIMVPAGYNFTPFFEAVEPFHPIINHHKYNNNYDYNKSIFLVNGDKHLDNGFLLVKEDARLASPLAVLYFEYYDDMSDAVNKLNAVADNIQCVVTQASIQMSNQVVAFGDSQHPRLWDYADGIDTMEFLSNL